MFEALPEEVTVYEVGPRDGLQNEAVPLGATDKVAFIQALVDAGVKRIEATSFVHPKWIPQLADAEKVCAGLPEAPGARFSALVPNVKGLERALKTRIHEIAIFLSASESHNKRNIHRTVAESLADYREVVKEARAAGRGVRGYVSTVFGCPYEGAVDPRAVIRLVGELKALGVDEVSLGDTIGVATPAEVYKLSRELVRDYGQKSLALHLHNTRGTALANVVAGLEAGIRVFDSTAGGLGGCPYAPGASGNLASEDLVYMLHGMGIRTGIDLVKLTRASKALEPLLGHALESNVVRSLSMHISQAEEGQRNDAFIPDPDARRQKGADVIALEPPPQAPKPAVTHS
jgi:hydroxymethylglutaryl-CoA lyase